MDDCKDVCSDDSYINGYYNKYLCVAPPYYMVAARVSTQASGKERILEMWLILTKKNEPQKLLVCRLGKSKGRHDKVMNLLHLNVYVCGRLIICHRQTSEYRPCK